MQRLSGKELRRLSQFLQDLYQLRTHEQFSAYLLAALPTITEGEFTSYNEYPHAGKPGVIKTDHDGFCSKIDYYQEIIFRYLDQHPMHTYAERTKKCTALTISDFLTTRLFRKTALYNEFFKPLSIPYVIGTPIAIDQDYFISIARHRDKKEFSESTRTVLDALRPHVIQSFRNALVVTRMQAQLTAMDQVMRAGNQGVVSATKAGRILFSNPHVHHLFGRFGLKSEQGQDWLPVPIRDWLRNEISRLESSDDVPLPLEPLIISGEEGKLHVRVIRKSPDYILLINEVTSRTALMDLASLGLSPRETEILLWVIRGKTNPEIGRILGISARTVQKHLERTYSRLGVENRHAAMTMAMSTLSQGAS